MGYYENFLTFSKFTKNEAGEVVADWPVLMTDGPIGGYSVSDTGAFVREAFKNGSKWIGEFSRIVRP